MIGTRERRIQLVLGKGIPRQSNRTIVKRLHQGHYLITEVQQFRCLGTDSCFMTFKDNKMIRLLSGATARTGIDVKQTSCICPRAGDTLMAYWDCTRVCGHSAAACAIFVCFPEGGIELVCMQARKIDSEEDEEGDLTALSMLQDMLLHSQGIRLQAANGLMAI